MGGGWWLEWKGKEKLNDDMMLSLNAEEESRVGVWLEEEEEEEMAEMRSVVCEASKMTVELQSLQLQCGIIGNCPAEGALNKPQIRAV